MLRKADPVETAREVPTEPDVWSLVQRAQQGETSCFEQLYRLHVGRVHALCLRMIGKGSEAEEMTQEVFVRAWQNLPKFKGQTHFPAWLHRVAINLVRNEWRTRARRGVHQELDEERPEVESARPRAVPGLRADLEQAIAGLPTGAREVFLLHDVHGYRHQEIAEMTGRAVGTTKAQLHRARRRLREAMKS